FRRSSPPKLSLNPWPDFRGPPHLQQIEGFPISLKNLCALLHPSATSPEITDHVSQALDTLKADPVIPIGEDEEGRYSFLSEKVSQVESERIGLIVTSTNRAQIQSRLMRELFQRTPSVNLQGTKKIDSGICLFDGMREQEVIGKDRTLRFLIQLVGAGLLEETKSKLVTESLGSQNSALIYLAAELPPKIEKLAEEIYRSEEIARIHRNDSDSEVVRYLKGQEHQAETNSQKVREFLEEALADGWIIFRGDANAVLNRGSSLHDALKNQLQDSASEVFSKYSFADQNVPAKVAPAFLKTQDLSQISSENDPLSVVSIQGSKTHVNCAHPALAEIQDFFGRHPNPEGKRLLDEFSRAPFGWSKDTTRYLVAALYYDQKIKIRVGGHDYSVIGDQALAAFKTNTSFNTVVIVPNNDQISPEVRQRAAQRLVDLTGENVLPLPQRISDVAREYVPKFLKEIDALPDRVSNLGLPEHRLSRLRSTLTNALAGDGSDAPAIFGAEDSELHDDLLWTRELKSALDHGAEKTLGELTSLLSQARNYAPELLKELEEAGSETISRVQDGSFHKDLPSLTHTYEDLKKRVDDYVAAQLSQLKTTQEQQAATVISSPDFQQLDDAAAAQIKQRLSELSFQPDPTLQGLSQATARFAKSSGEILSLQEEVKKATAPPEPDLTHAVTLPARIATREELETTIAALTACQDALSQGKTIYLSFGQK
ncbi:hypothetical protein, partial [Roseibacillus ishigakijimensis]